MAKVVERAELYELIPNWLVTSKLTYLKTLLTTSWILLCLLWKWIVQGLAIFFSLWRPFWPFGWRQLLSIWPSTPSELAVVAKYFFAEFEHLYQESQRGCYTQGKAWNSWSCWRTARKIQTPYQTEIPGPVILQDPKTIRLDRAGCYLLRQPMFTFRHREEWWASLHLKWENKSIRS